METEFYFDDCFAMLDATPVTMNLLTLRLWLTFLLTFLLTLINIQPLSPDGDLITITFDIQQFLPYLLPFTDILA